MPMRLKSDLYKKEQEDVIEKIISILDLTNKNTYTLYELDTNIYKIAHNAINNKERPNYLSRSNNLSGFLEEFPKSKFTCLEIGKP